MSYLFGATLGVALKLSENLPGRITEVDDASDTMMMLTESVARSLRHFGRTSTNSKFGQSEGTPPGDPRTLVDFFRDGEI